MSNIDTLVSKFETQVEHNRDLPAVFHEHETFSYEQLNRMANKLAHLLIQSTVYPEEPIALCMERSHWLVAAIWGILKAGGVYVPLDSQHPQERRQFIIDDTKTKKIVTTASEQHLFENFSGELFVIEHLLEKLELLSDTNPNVYISPNQLAYIIYTSGSTGKPKGVVVEHHSLLNYAEWFRKYTDSKPQTIVDFSSKNIFDMAITTSIVPLILGLSIHACSDEIKKDHSLYLKHCADSRINLIKITPSFFRILILELKSHKIELPDLKTIILGGEALTKADCVAWLSMYPEHILYNEYGPTEATVAVSSFKITPSVLSTLDKQVPIGMVGTNMHWYILDDEDKLCKVNEVGNLFVGGDCLARGYLNQEALTKQQFIEHPQYGKLYRTGDLCRKLTDGNIIFEGRRDEQLKIRGFRVEPGEIEHCLLKLPEIENAFVLAREDRHEEKKLVVYFLLKNENITIENETIRKYLSLHLPEYMIPAAYVRLEHIPMTPNGKLDHKALPNPHYVTNQDFRSPKTDLEKLLTAIWVDELDVDPIGVKDNFFTLGGNSLLAARIITRIKQELHKDLSLHEFYKHSCIEELCSLLEKKDIVANIEEESSDKPMTKQWPLSDFQFMLWLADLFEPKIKHLNIVGRRRYHGHIDPDELNKSYLALLKKHDVLSYRQSKYKPMQYKSKIIPTGISTHYLSTCTSSQIEDKLKLSLRLLSSQKDWSDKDPWIKIKVYYLPKNMTEIHVSMPHIISDDYCIDIIFSELSLNYNSQQVIEEKPLSGIQSYHHYVLQEQVYVKKYLHRDINFWREYLKHTSTIRFPESFVVSTNQVKDFNYSTYKKLDESCLVNIQRFCANNRVSFMDGWCAIIAKSLHEISPQNLDEGSSVLLNIVKSTRHSHRHNETLGCFLRLEPIKLNQVHASGLAELAQKIHASVIETEPHQPCPGMVKLASIHDVVVHKSRIKNFVLRSIASLYLKLFPSLGLDKSYLNLCAQLSNFEKKNNFLINVNVLSHILKSKKDLKQQNEFGLHSVQSTFYHPDLINVDNVLDICLMRDPVDYSAYVVVSANLTPDFRLKIADKIKSTLKQHCV